MAKVKRQKQSSPIRSLMSPTKMAIPIIIGVGIAGFLLFRDLGLNALSSIELNELFGILFVNFLLL